jgi:hypothetical protein
METTIYQKFVSRYAETFTLVEMSEGDDYHSVEIVPAGKVAKMSEEEVEELIDELTNWQNEKASWNDGHEEFNDEDARTAYHQKWNEIDSDLDNRG